MITITRKSIWTIVAIALLALGGVTIFAMVYAMDPQRDTTGKTIVVNITAFNVQILNNSSFSNRGYIHVVLQGIDSHVKSSASEPLTFLGTLILNNTNASAFHTIDSISVAPNSFTISSLGTTLPIQVGEVGFTLQLTYTGNTNYTGPVNLIMHLSS